MPKSDKDQENFLFSIYVFSVLSIKVFLGGVMPIYAMIKDFQNDKIIWAIFDFILFFSCGNATWLNVFALLKV